jgi:uncharacterized protein
MFAPVPEKAGQPLSEAELDQLGEFLESLGPRAMNLEQLDGFFAALIAGPDIVLPSEYWPEVVGSEFEYESIEQAQKIIELVMRHWSTIATTLNAGDIHEPIMLLDDEGVARGNDWGKGFVRGMVMRGEEWLSYTKDEAHSGSILPMMMLAHESDPDPKLRTPIISSEKRQELIALAAAGLTRIFKHFQAQRTSEKRQSMPKTYVRDTDKVGRNDPCPCHSGKKFKQCCGSNRSTH